MTNPRCRGQMVLLAVILLASMATNALSASFTLIDGNTHEGTFAGLFLFGGLEYLVFELPDGSVGTYLRSDVASIQLGAGIAAPVGVYPGTAIPGPPPAEDTAAYPPYTSVYSPARNYVRTEREPNDDLQTANPIATGTDVTGAIDHNGDHDYYLLDVPTHGTFRVTCTQPADLYLALLDGAGEQIVGGDYGGPGRLMEMNKDVYEAGDYYVLVRGYSSGSKSDTPYDLRVDFDPAYDDLEPNDDIHQASPVVSGRKFDSYIYKPGDKDYYRIDVSWPSTIEVDSTQPADYYLAIMDATGEGQLYGGDYGGPGRQMQMKGDVYEPGTYYVLMRGYSQNSYDMHTPYEITITVTTGGPDNFEPNDAPREAAAAPINRPFQAYISRPGDHDYYRVDVDGPAEIIVESDQPADYWLGILDTDGSTVLKGGDYGGPGNAMKASTFVFERGTYYVLMRGYSQNSYNMHTPYNMTITVRPELRDAAEPNDSARDAKNLRIGQPVQGVISTPTDEDWWRFTAPPLGKVRITCTQPGDFRLRVVDSRGQQIVSGDFGGKGNLMSTICKVTPSEVYYVVVEPYSSSSFNMHEAYQLTVSPWDL